MGRVDMSLLSIRLDWQKDSAGYELADHGKRGFYVVGKGGDLVPFRPLEGNDVVFTAFAKVNSPATLLNFVSHYGLLEEPACERPFDTETRQGYVLGGEFFHFDEEAGGLKLRPTGEAAPSGERVSDHLETAALFRRVMTGGAEALRRDPLLTAVKEAIWKTAELGELTAEVDSKQGFRLAIAVNSLLAGLWLQLAQGVLGHRSFNTCRSCGSIFEVGVTFGRRADAKFCSDAHRIEFNSHKRSKRS
jgi:hypothetical protein